MLQIVFPFYSNQIPALMAIGMAPIDAALVQSTRLLAFFCKILLPQKIAVLRTGGRIKWGVEDVAGLVAHRSDLVWLLNFYFWSISKQGDLGFEELLWIGQVLPLQCLVNTGLVVISGDIKISSRESTHWQKFIQPHWNYLLLEFSTQWLQMIL